MCPGSSSSILNISLVIRAYFGHYRNETLGSAGIFSRSTVHDTLGAINELLLWRQSLGMWKPTLIQNSYAKRKTSLLLSHSLPRSIFTNNWFTLKTVFFHPLAPDPVIKSSLLWIMAPRKTLLYSPPLFITIYNYQLKGTWSFIIREQRSNFASEMQWIKGACHRITIELIAILCMPKLVVVTHGLMFVQVQINQTVPFVKGNWCMEARENQ